MKGLRFMFQSLGRKVRGSGTRASEALIGCKVPRNLLDPSAVPWSLKGEHF